MPLFELFLLFIFSCFIFSTFEIACISYYLRWKAIGILGVIFSSISLGIFSNRVWGNEGAATVFISFLLVSYSIPSFVLRIIKSSSKKTIFHSFISSDYYPVGPKIENLEKKHYRFANFDIELPMPKKSLHKQDQYYGSFAEKTENIETVYASSTKHQKYLKYEWLWYGDREPARYAAPGISFHLETLTYEDDIDLSSFQAFKKKVSQYIYCQFHFPTLPTYEEDSFLLKDEPFDSSIQHSRGIKILLQDEDCGVVIIYNKDEREYLNYTIFKALKESTVLIIKFKILNSYLSNKDSLYFCNYIIQHTHIDGKNLFENTKPETLMSLSNKYQPTNLPYKIDAEYKNRQQLRRFYLKHAKDPFSWRAFEHSANYDGWLQWQHKSQRAYFGKKIEESIKKNMADYDAFLISSNSTNGFLGQESITIEGVDFPVEALAAFSTKEYCIKDDEEKIGTLSIDWPETFGMKTSVPNVNIRKMKSNADQTIFDEFDEMIINDAKKLRALYRKITSNGTRSV